MSRPKDPKPAQLALPMRGKAPTASIRDPVIMALGCAERARRELVEANDHMRRVVGLLGLSHPSVAKIAAALRDTSTAVQLLTELRSRLPQ